MTAAHYQENHYYTVHPNPAPVAAGEKRDYGSLRPKTLDERVTAWFRRPLSCFAGNDVFVCLMVCLPLIEKWVRYKLRLANQEFERDSNGVIKKDGYGNPIEVRFKKNSNAIRLVAEFLHLSDPGLAFTFWNNSRNGILHRGMIKDDLKYVLRPETSGRIAVTVEGKEIHVCPWIIRDLVMHMLDQMPREFWINDTAKLPEVYEPAT